MATRTGYSDEGAVGRRRTVGGGGAWAGVAGGIILLLLLALILIPLFTGDDSTGPERGATVSNITDNPEEYIGETVTVSGEVEAAIGDRVFTIGGQEFLGGQSLLVVSANPLPTAAGRTPGDAVLTNDIIQVTGPVRRFNVAEFEQAIGTALDDGLFTEFEGQPAVIARSVDLTPRSGNAGTQSVPVTVSNLADNPEEYFGQTVTLSGPITNVVSPNAFILDGQVLAVGWGNAAPGDSPTQGNRVQATGIYRAFDLAEFEQDLGVDLQDDVFTDWGNRPALLIKQVQPVR